MNHGAAANRGRSGDTKDLHPRAAIADRGGPPDPCPGGRGVRHPPDWIPRESRPVVTGLEGREPSVAPRQAAANLVQRFHSKMVVRAVPPAPRRRGPLEGGELPAAIPAVQLVLVAVRIAVLRDKTRASQGQDGTSSGEAEPSCRRAEVPVDLGDAKRGGNRHRLRRPRIPHTSALRSRKIPRWPLPLDSPRALGPSAPSALRIPLRERVIAARAVLSRSCARGSDRFPCAAP
jgi:hypothetical protein